MRTTVRAPSPMRWPRSVARRTVAWRTVARRTVAPRKVVASHGLVEAAVVARWLVAPWPRLLVAPRRRPVAHLLLLRETLRRKALPIRIVHGRPAGRRLAAAWRRPVCGRARPTAGARRRAVRASIALALALAVGTLVAAVVSSLVARVCHHGLEVRCALRSRASECRSARLPAGWVMPPLKEFLEVPVN